MSHYLKTFFFIFVNRMFQRFIDTPHYLMESIKSIKIMSYRNMYINIMKNNSLNFKQGKILTFITFYLILYYFLLCLVVFFTLIQIFLFIFIHFTIINILYLYNYIFIKL